MKTSRFNIMMTEADRTKLEELRTLMADEYSTAISAAEIVKRLIRKEYRTHQDNK